MNSAGAALGEDGALLRIRALHKRFPRRERWRTRDVVVLRDVDLDIEAGSVLAVLGESGAGKSTLARCIVGMERPDAGSICFDGIDMSRLSARDFRQVAQAVQLIFQDPSTALNPRLTAEELIAEPLLVQRRGTRESRIDTAKRLMSEVGLSPDWSRRRPSEFSGGQLQRIAIARALAIEPKLLILDEAFSGLDLSTAAQIANLLLDLRAVHNLTYILISHDISFAAQFADEIAVMAAGTIVERGPSRRVLESPKAEATRALVESAKLGSMALSRAAGDGA